MTTSQQNCLKAVIKIEGTKLEDELGVSHRLIHNAEGEVITVTLGNPNNFLQRVLGALNKESYERKVANQNHMPYFYMIIDIARGHDWNHSKDIQDDSTYDKITKLLI